jgi:transglutaminase-like putative cysteine protease
MKNYFLYFLLLIGSQSFAQGIYDVEKISPDLKLNASVIVRSEDRTFDRKSTTKATYVFKTAVTILNRNGEEASSMMVYYDKNSSVYNLKASMYDASGKKIKDYKNSDFSDGSAISDGSIYEDGRFRKITFFNSNYPYTVEYSYAVDYYGISNIPSWSPVPDFGYSIEKSQYTLKTPQTLSFKSLKSAGLKTDSSKVKDLIQYSWVCENFKALEYEPLSTSLKNVTPWVLLAPNDFEYDGYPGNMNTWKELGSWINKLNSEPQVLPLQVKEKVASLISNAKTPKEKIKRLYSYLQANTRYVSVQLGIGGFRPINADKVAAVNYGDCKALSNYMKTLLKEAGISSNLVVIGYDMPSLNEKFASLNQANHMILCVPLQKDTVWLECTSQYVPAGHLDNGCSDKNVLLITEDGGKIVRSPIYSPDDNFQKRKVKVDLNETGESIMTVTTEYGDAQYDLEYQMMLLEPTEQRKRMTTWLDIPNFTLSTLSYTQPNKDVAVVKETITLKSQPLPATNADRQFITLNVMNRRGSVPAKVVDRKTNFSVPFGYHDEDEVTIVIPKGYKVEYLPKELIIESEFGKYIAKAEVKGNTIVYSRTQIMNGKKFSPDKYNSMVDFYSKIYKADKVKGLLAKIE